MDNESIQLKRKKKKLIWIVSIVVIILALFGYSGRHVYKWAMGFDYFLPKMKVTNVTNIANPTTIDDSSGLVGKNSYCASRPLYSNGKIMYNYRDGNNIGMKLYNIDTKMNFDIVKNNTNQCGVRLSRNYLLYTDFANKEDGNSKLYLYNLTTKEVKTINAATNNHLYHIILSDKFMIYSTDPAFNSNEYEILDTSTLSNKTLSVTFNGPTSIDDDKIIWMPNQSAIKIYNYSSGQTQTISTEDAQAKNNPGWYKGISPMSIYAIDNKIYWNDSRNCTKNIEGCSGEDIYMYDLDKKQVFRLTNNTAENYCRYNYIQNFISDGNYFSSSLTVQYLSGSRTSVYVKNLKNNKEYILTSRPSNNNFIDEYYPLGIYKNNIAWLWADNNNEVNQIYIGTLAEN